MKLIFYIFLFSQLLNFIGIFAEKVKDDSSEINSVIWEKLEENKSKPLKIIWKSFKPDENYFTNENQAGFSVNQVSGGKSSLTETSAWRNRILRFSFEKLICQMAVNLWVCTV